MSKQTEITEEAKMTEKQPKEESTKAAEQPKTVKIRLPLTREEKDDVFVGLNGRTYLIKRGETVEVPEGVAEILKHREEMLMQAMEFESMAAAPLKELSK